MRIESDEYHMRRTVRRDVASAVTMWETAGSSRRDAALESGSGRTHRLAQSGKGVDPPDCPARLKHLHGVVQPR